MDNILVTIALGSTVVVLYIYKYLKDVYSFWEIRGFPYIEPNILFGNVTKIVLGQIAVPIEYRNIYRQLAPHPYGGIYTIHRPTLVIRDPELIKRILTKDFSYFHDRGIQFDHKLEPITRNLLGLRGQEWKALRINMTSAFSTRKMKQMFPLMEECAKQLVSVLAETDTTIEGIEMKDTLARYTTDVVGSCLFGLNTGCIKDPNSQFRVIGELIFKFRYQIIVRLFIPDVLSKLVTWFKIYYVHENVSKFFVSLVKDSMEYREKNKIVRNDLLDILINLRNNSDLKQENTDSEVRMLRQIILDDGEKLDMTIELMAAQFFILLGAGFEITSNTLSFFFLEIAKHPQIQEKLQKEIYTVLKRNNDQLSYSGLKEMKYLDMVLNETMRMYPGSGYIPRECVKNYKIPGSHLVIPKGILVYIPVIGLHHDEQYYKNPDIFTPENFEEETKLQRHQYAYLPFGEGPRKCIAARFSKLLMQIVIVHLIRNYTFHLAPKMRLPVELKHSGLLCPKRGVWLQCRQRK